MILSSYKSKGYFTKLCCDQKALKLLLWKQIFIVFFCILCRIQLISTLFIIFLRLKYHNSIMSINQEHQLTFVSNMSTSLHCWFQYARINSYLHINSTNLQRKERWYVKFGKISIFQSQNIRFPKVSFS